MSAKVRTSLPFKKKNSIVIQEIRAYADIMKSSFKNNNYITKYPYMCVCMLSLFSSVAPNQDRCGNGVPSEQGVGLSL